MTLLRVMEMVCTFGSQIIFDKTLFAPILNGASALNLRSVGQPPTLTLGGSTPIFSELTVVGNNNSGLINGITIAGTIGNQGTINVIYALASPRVDSKGVSVTPMYPVDGQWWVSDFSSSGFTICVKLTSPQKEHSGSLFSYVAL